MGKRPNKSFDHDGKESKKIQGLQQQLKEKNKYIKQLEGELKTLETAFKKSAAYMSKESKDLSVEELISAANKDATLEQAKKQKPKNVPVVKRPPSVEEVQKKREEARAAALKWRKENLGNYEEE